MKTSKTATDNGTKANSAAKPETKIQTDFPLSEKDEVKKAEHQLNKGAKKGDK